MKGFARLTHTFLSSAELSEVLRGYGSVSLERDRESAHSLAADGDVKEDDRVDARFGHIFVEVCLFSLKIITKVQPKSFKRIIRQSESRKEKGARHLSYPRNHTPLYLK